MNLLDCYYSKDGNDYSPAFSRAIIASKSNRDEVIHIPTGRYRLTKPISFPRGTVLMGGGGCSSNLGQGTVLVADFDVADALEWNGDEDYCGTGGGMERIVIAAERGRSPGAAISLYARTPKNRAGYFDIQRVLVYAGSDAGTFETGLLVDGRQVTIPGSAGVRDVSVRAFHAYGCRRQAIMLANCIHFQGSIQTGMGTAGNADVVVMGGSENIQIEGRIWGKLVLDECRGVRMKGMASSYVIGKWSKDVRIDDAPDLNRS